MVVVLAMLGVITFAGYAWHMMTRGGTPEAEGKAIVTRTEQVQGLIAEHGDEHVRVLALAQHRVHDRDLIAELYPAADRGEVTCVIVATAGDDGYVFLQGENFEILRTETLPAFTRRTGGVDPELLARFWLSLA